MISPRPSLAPLTTASGLLYGADYNPEQWPEETWVQDVSLMRGAGINLVTVGVFSWARLEPSEGVWDFGWLDRVLELLHGGGIRVNLATPTASPPPWLGHRYPETLPVDASGRTLWYGSRNQFNPSSAKYRQAAAAVTQALASRYAGHPAVAMWHVGNELGQVSYDGETAAAFRKWLRARYGGLEGLNSAWGTAFWSQQYSSWEEILPPRLAPYIGNPGQDLDFRRFTSDELLDLFRTERDIIRRYDSRSPITTNLMGFFGGADYFSFAGETDVTANDWYTDPADPGSPLLGSLTADLCRGLSGGGSWLLMESATSAVNWREHNVPKDPGALRVDALSAVARGADGVCFFQFRQSAAGAERFHSAMVPLAGASTRIYRETAALGAELQALRPVAGAPAPARVAFLFDWSSWWAAESPARPSSRLRVMDQMMAYYRPLHRLGLAVEVVPPTASLDRFDLVVAPNLFLLAPQSAKALEDYVRSGGALVVGPFSGVADETGQLATGRFPALLRDLLGVGGEEWRPLKEPVPVSFSGDDTTDGGTDGPRDYAQNWSEDLEPTGPGTGVLARFAAGPLAGKPAATRNSYGNGTAWYVGADLTSAGLARVLDDALAASGLPVPVPAGLPDDVEAVSRGNLLFVLNHGGKEREVTLPAGGVDLLTGVRHGPVFLLPPRGAYVLTTESSKGTP